MEDEISLISPISPHEPYMPHKPYNPKTHNMKKLILFFLLCFQCAMFNVQCSMALAQQMPPVPLDPAVKTGKLENGLTYFIRHNE